MLLIKKSSHGLQNLSSSASSFVHSLRRGLSQALPTMDRRSFLRRSGLGVGVGIAASQLALVKKSNAAEGAKVGLGDSKIETLEDMAFALKKYKPGQQVDVIVLRDGQRVVLKTTLKARTE